MAQQKPKHVNLDGDFNVSQSTLDLLFWMLEASHSATLEKQGTALLIAHFGSVEVACQYRSEKESQQFMLNQIYAKNPPIKSISA